MRGLKKVYKYGEEDVSITDLLRKPEVVHFLEKDRALTYATQRDKLRRLLEKFKDGLKRTIDDYNIADPIVGEQRQRDILNGTQHIMAGLPKKNMKGHVVGPLRIPREKRLTAKEALRRFPALRGFLQGNRKITEKSLQAKYRLWKKARKYPDEIFDPEPEIVPRGRLLGGGVVGQYMIIAKVNTSPTDFLNRTRNVIINFLREKPQNKVRFVLVCVMIRVDPATGKVIAEENTYFNSKIEVVYETTDLNEVYNRMITRIIESFSSYLKNVSGWMLKRVVRLDITLARFYLLCGSSHIPLLKAIGRKKGSN